MEQVAAKSNILPSPEKWRQMKKGSRCKVYSSASPFCPLKEVLCTFKSLPSENISLSSEREEEETKAEVQGFFYIPAHTWELLKDLMVWRGSGPRLPLHLLGWLRAE